MKKLIITLLCATVGAMTMAASLPVKVVGTPPSNSVANTVVNTLSNKRSSHAVTKLSAKSAAQINAVFKLNSSNEQYVYDFIAVPTNATTEGCYQADMVDKTHFSIALPAGTYDLMSIVDDDDSGERIFLIEEDVIVPAEGVSVEFDVADAAYATRISHTDSEGTVLTLPSYNGPSNCTCADYIDVVTHNGVMAWAGETLAYMECNYILKTNKADSRFSFLRSDIIGAAIESAAMNIPIDFNREVCGPTSTEGWQVAYSDFAPKPFMQAYDNYCLETYGELDYYTFLTRALVIDGEWWGISGIGIFEMSCDSRRVAIWAPDGYSGKFDVMLTQISNVVSGDDSSVQSMFLMRSDDGLTQVGLNMPVTSKGNIFARNGEGESITRQFSRYSGKPQAGVRGNATPLLLACTDPSGFFFTYKGRYGEDLSIDAYNMMSSFDDEELVEQLGGNPSDVKIYADGKLICSSIKDLPWKVDWIEGADNRAEIEMGHVLIDGVTPGHNSAVIEWNAGKGNGFAPTFTSLQFRDTADNISDRFEKSEDGVIEFTVGDLAMKHNAARQYFYYDINEVKSVSAEYAPHGNTDFTAIDVTEIPELFFTPGYGYFYRGSLAGVDRVSADGWFDLRLRAEDADGAYIEQIISPAFKISNLSGIPDISADTDRLYHINGNDITVAPGVRIFSTDGKQHSGRNMERGIYIISNGTKTAKIVI